MFSVGQSAQKFCLITTKLYDYKFKLKEVVMCLYQFQNSTIYKKDKVTITLHKDKNFHKAGGISFLPGLSKYGGTCADDVPCINQCDAIYQMERYKGRRKAWKNNTEVLYTDMPKLFEIIDIFLGKCVDVKITHFQIHHAGDFINQTEINNWLSLSKQYKDIHFMAFTKRFEFSYTITDNFKVIYSIWPGRKMPPLNGIPLAFLDIDDTNRHPSNYNTFLCPISQGNTEECKKCFDIGSYKAVILQYFDKDHSRWNKAERDCLLY